MEQEKMDGLPEGWKTVKLWTVCNFLNGFAFQSNKYCDSGHRVIRIANVQKGRLVDTEPKFIDENELKCLERFVLSDGDLLISLTWNVGRTAFIPRKMLPAVLNQRVWKISPNKLNLRPDYIFYLFQSQDFENDCISNAVGAAQKNMSLRWLEEYTIPLPPLPEQERIVEKLDRIFEHIDASIKLLEQNISDADALSKSMLSEIFDGQHLPGEWKAERLWTVCELIGWGTPKTHVTEYWTDDITWLSPSDLPPIGEISTVKTSAKKISRLGLENSSAKLLPIGTVTFSSRASIGKIGITEIELATNQWFANFVCGPKIRNHFLAYLLKYKTPGIASLSNSTTFAEVSRWSLRAFEISLPPLAEQERIVAKLDAFFAEQKAMKSRHETKVSELKALRSSILSEALQGKI